MISKIDSQVSSNAGSGQGRHGGARYKPEKTSMRTRVKDGIDQKSNSHGRRKSRAREGGGQVKEVQGQCVVQAVY